MLRTPTSTTSGSDVAIGATHSRVRRRSTRGVGTPGSRCSASAWRSVPQCRWCQPVWPAPRAHPWCWRLLAGRSARCSSPRRGRRSTATRPTAPPERRPVPVAAHRSGRRSPCPRHDRAEGGARRGQARHHGGGTRRSGGHLPRHAALPLRAGLGHQHPGPGHRRYLVRGPPVVGGDDHADHRKGAVVGLLSHGEASGGLGGQEAAEHEQALGGATEGQLDLLGEEEEAVQR